MNVHCSLLSHKDGQTNINVKRTGKRGVSIRNNDEQDKGIIEYAISRPMGGNVVWDWNKKAEKLYKYRNLMIAGDKLHCVTDVNNRKQADLTLTTAQYDGEEKEALITYFSLNYYDHGSDWSDDSDFSGKDWYNYSTALQ